MSGNWKLFRRGGDSVGIENVDKNISPEYASKWWLDNGIYEVENWEIKSHWNPELLTEEYHEGYDLKEMLLDIDASMPEKEQLGKDFILAETVDTSSLEPGDKVYLQKFNGRYEIHTIIGFGKKGECWDEGVRGLPYVDLYENDGVYSKNANNYIKDEKIRKVGK